MAERPTRAPDIPVRTLGGLNERPSKANLRPGEFSVLEGLYPSSVGLQSRIPGKVAVDLFSGVVLQIIDTQNTNGDVLYQVGDSLYASTIDDIQGRAVTPVLVYNPSGEEELMSQAIIVQREANGTDGGSGSGFQSGSPTELAATFYGRRLTDILVNESSTVTTFTASAGGGASASTEGTFTLSPGTYRITIEAMFNLNGGGQIVFGLYNVTSSVFEVYSGGSDPIVSTPLSGTATINFLSVLKGKITVSSTNKTYAIRQQATVQATIRGTAFGGARYTGATATINGAAPKQTYCFVEILKTT